MYKTVVARRVERIFASITAGDYQPMLESLGRDFVYVFHGDHALAGRRTTRSAMIAWWERAFRLMPHGRFDVREVLVSGWPWKTRVATRLRVSAALQNGAPYENVVFQFMTLRWGRVTSIETMENLQVLERALEVQAAAGQQEALARPIMDADE